MPKKCKKPEKDCRMIADYFKTLNWFKLKLRWNLVENSQIRIKIDKFGLKNACLCKCHISMDNIFLYTWVVMVIFMVCSPIPPLDVD